MLQINPGPFIRVRRQTDQSGNVSVIDVEKIVIVQHLVGSANETLVCVDDVPTQALLDLGSMVTCINKSFV